MNKALTHYTIVKDIAMTTGALMGKLIAAHAFGIGLYFVAKYLGFY